jgi:hypothetical protein
LNIRARSNLCGAAVGAGDSPFRRASEFTAASVTAGRLGLIAVTVIRYDSNSAARRREVNIFVSSNASLAKDADKETNGGRLSSQKGDEQRLLKASEAESKAGV